MIAALHKARDGQRIWTPENRYAKWLDVEIAVCEAWAERDIPKKAVAAIKKRQGLTSRGSMR